MTQLSSIPLSHMISAAPSTTTGTVGGDIPWVPILVSVGTGLFISYLISRSMQQMTMRMLEQKLTQRTIKDEGQED